MLLVIDAGNTNIVLGSMEGETVRFMARLASDRQKTGDEYALELSALLHLHKVKKDFEGAVIASVVPTLTDRLCYAVRLVTGCETFVVIPGIKTGFPFKTENPASLGADLLANMAAAKARYPLPVFIFDLGTATTLSVLDGSGAYAGGLIMPGPALGMEALAERASKLFPISLTPPEKLLGGNTADCMRAGTLFGHAAMLDGLAERAERELGEKAAAIVATGGLAPVVAPLCERKLILDETLTLRGLALLYTLNQKEP